MTITLNPNTGEPLTHVTARYLSTFLGTHLIRSVGVNTYEVEPMVYFCPVRWLHLRTCEYWYLDEMQRVFEASSKGDVA